MSRVIVTDAGRGSAIAFIRSLGRRGVDVVAADADPRSPGFRSRYASAALWYPPPARDPEGMVDVLLHAARSRDVDLIVPVTDDVLLPLARRRSLFDDVCQLAIAPDAALAQTADKQATIELARSLGVPVPPTAVVRTAAEAGALADELGWPIVLKPQSSRLVGETGVEAFTVTYANDAARLATAMGRFEGRCPVLLQRYVRGEGHGVELLLRDGEPLAAFQHRRLHEVPLSGGASAFRESVSLDPELEGHALRLMRALRWTGLAMVEFKLTPAGPLLMEINGRIWGSLPLAVKSGVDFPARLAALHLDDDGESAEPSRGYALGVRSRNLELEVVWILSVLRGRRRYPFLPSPARREGAFAALRLPWPPDGYDILSLRDPSPGLSELARIGRKLWTKLADGR
ncbi:MAG: ATP-grasp domain-containing protein [Thermoleophilia bacterium]|nr:ATP-grasp domain-containing protein [Thermoleophilia bacterium]